MTRRSSRPLALQLRGVQIQPDSIDEPSRSVGAVLATEAPIFSHDGAGKTVLEVWRMDGVEFSDKVPLLDSHQRGSVHQVLGGANGISVENGQLVGRISVSESEPNTWTKIREGHLTDLSCGIQVLEFVNIPAGRTRVVRGQSYQAPKDSPLRIVTRWRLREVSVTPFGADPSAKFRSEEFTMKDETRKYLESIGLSAEATPEEAQAFYDSLPDETKALADAAAPADDAARADDDPPAADDDDPDAKRAKRSAIVVGERKRIAEITRLGEGLSADVVRKAIDDGLTVAAAAVQFVPLLRSTRSAPVKPASNVVPGAPAIHSRSHEDDCSAETLAMAFALRSVDGNKIYSRAADYAPATQGSSNFVLQRSHNVEARKTRVGRLLEEGQRYSSMSMMDIGREACRLDGKPISLRSSPEEVFRAAVSGSSLMNIFTTNVNAQLLVGYMDAADSTVGWVTESDVGNFLTQERATMGKFGGLKKLAKGRKAIHLDVGDTKEEYKIARYAGQFVVDEQDFINDRFGALEQTSPMDMGLSAAQLRPNLVYSLLLANGALGADSVALFHATHGNLGTNGTALAAASLQAAITAMAKQRIRDRVLNIAARYLIVPQDQVWTADILIQSVQRIIAAESGGTYNPLANRQITVVGDDRIGVAGCVDPVTDQVRAGSATNWFLAARPGEEGAKTIEVGYLRGSGRAPQIRSFVLDKGEWGMGWDIKFDIGAKALDFRGLYKATGAA